MNIWVQVENFGDEKSIRYQLVESTYTYRTHMHQFIELFIVLDGEVNVTVDERSETITKNHAAFIFSFQPHKYSSKARSKVAIFVFSAAMIPEFFKSADGMVSDRAVFPIKPSTLYSFTERIFEKDTYDVYDIKGCLYHALQDFLSTAHLVPAAKKANISAGIVHYLSEHLTEEITLETVAQSLGYSPKYLSNRIKRIFDMNFTRLIANARVDKARHLLRETNKTRAEICYECGFGSERSFHRQFKQILNCTPTEYRAKHLPKIDMGRVNKFD